MRWVVWSPAKGASASPGSSHPSPTARRGSGSSSTSPSLHEIGRSWSSSDASSVSVRSPIGLRAVRDGSRRAHFASRASVPTTPPPSRSPTAICCPRRSESSSSGGETRWRRTRGTTPPSGAKALPPVPSADAVRRCADEGCAGRTTTVPPATDQADFHGGFIAAEGCFSRTGEPPRFAFVVGLGARDAGQCERLLAFLGVGFISTSSRRKAHYDDEVAFQVRKLVDLVHVVVPFMDEHLPPSFKRQQYEQWRGDLLAHWHTSARRVRRCTVAGCQEPRRAHGLCRRHLYRLRGV